MPRIRPYIPIICLVCTVACSPGGEEPSSPEAAGPEVEITPGAEGQWRENRLVAGKETYQKACASCHDEGLDDAPVTGDQDSWTDRSRLWSAVLFEHAKAGYLDMPEKGGQSELTDASVEAAAEYMLSETFPEMPRD